MKQRSMLSIALCLVLFACSAFAGGGVFTATNVSRVVVPAAGVANAPAWVTNQPYTQGTYAKMPSSQILMCLVAGTSTNTDYKAPSSAGADVLDNTVTWRPVLKKRRTLIIQNLSTNNVWINTSFTAATNSGVWLAPSGGSISWNGESCPQKAFTVISDGTSPSPVLTLDEP